MSKKSRTERRINGGLAIYYGMGAMLGAVGSVLGLLVWGVKVFMSTKEFHWDVPVAVLIFGALAGFVGYLLLRVGYEEIED